MSSDRPLRRGDGFVEERTTASGEPRYLARWHDGTRWRSKTFLVDDDAYDHLRKIGARKRRGKDVSVSDLTVLDVVDDYLDRGTHRWKPNTRATYGSIRDGVINGPMGRRRVADLTPRIVQHWIDQLADQYAPARVEMIRAVLGGALKEAMRLGIIDQNPSAGVSMPKARRREPTIWSAADVATVLATVRDDVTMLAYYALALTTGMRPGELRALGWADVDLERGVVTVRRTMTRDAEYRPVIGDTTKTGRARSIAIPAATGSALKAQRRAQAERRRKTQHWRDDGLVFDRGNGAPIPQQTIARRHAAIIDRTGVPAVRLHDLRHSAATAMLEGGVPLKVVSDVLGHTTIATTADIYSHTGDVLRRHAADVLGGLLPEGETSENTSENT
jgi:integrase